MSLIKTGALGAAIVLGAQQVKAMDAMKETLTVAGIDLRPIAAGVLIAKFGGGLAGVHVGWVDALILGGGCTFGADYIVAAVPQVAQVGAVAPYGVGAVIAIGLVKFGVVKGGGEKKTAAAAA